MMPNCGSFFSRSNISVANRSAFCSQLCSVGCMAWLSEIKLEQSPPKVHTTASILNIVLFIGKYLYERTFQILGTDLHHHDCVDCGLPLGCRSTLVQHLELWILLAIVVLLALDGFMLHFFPIAPAVTG